MKTNKHKRDTIATSDKLKELTILFEEFGRIYNDNFFLNNYKQQQIKNK